MAGQTGQVFRAVGADGGRAGQQVPRRERAVEPRDERRRRRRHDAGATVGVLGVADGAAAEARSRQRTGRRVVQRTQTELGRQVGAAGAQPLHVADAAKSRKKRPQKFVRR